MACRSETAIEHHLTLAGLSPSDVAKAVFEAADGANDAPVWLDGGNEHLPPYQPGRHRISAFPTSLRRIAVADLPSQGLVDWLRRCVPVSSPGSRCLAPMTVVGLSYDAGRNLESVPVVATADSDAPDVVVATYAAFFAYDGQRWQLHATNPSHATRLLNCIRQRPSNGPDQHLQVVEPLTSNLELPDYARRHQRLLESLRAGDLYQANLARRLESRLGGQSPAALYASMRATNPAALGVLWRYDEDRWIASSSPECLLDYDPIDRLVHSYPIKGTRKRLGEETRDRATVAELRTDPKECAEHVMIVDLVRNDLGRVCEFGSVTVPSLFDVMQLPSVHHLVSDICGRLRQEHDVFDLLGALFPGGSITGAPKVAAMQAIERLEPVRRGFYTGSVGVHLASGAATYNILIRTCLIDGDRLRYSTGGGIVVDSIAEREWEETEEKAAALVATLRS